MSRPEATRLDGRVALVTGGGAGIGRATALALARFGAAVAVNDLRESKAADVVREIEGMGGRAVPAAADVSDRTAVDAMVETVVTGLGGLDVLVNNAGFAEIVPLAEMTDGQLERMMRVHLFGAFFTARAALPHLRRRPGTIINVASDLGQLGCEGMSHYAAAKGGLIALTKSLARELAPLGIRVNAVAPGATRTPLLSAFPADYAELEMGKYPMGRFGEADEIAAAIRFLASDEASYFTGQVLAPNGGEVMMG